VEGRLPEGKVELEATDLNLGKMGLLSFLAGIEGGATLSEAKATLNGDLSQLSSLSGDVRITLSKLVLDAQNFMGFNLPQTSAKDGLIDVNLSSGKVKITTARIGKAGDDLSLQLSGDLKLSKYLPSSEMNLKSKISFSEGFHKAIPLLDTILAAGKIPEGGYAFKLSGTLGAPFPSPDK
jgi:type II secretion system protein N